MLKALFKGDIMSYYSLTQWIIFFGLYCFIGWIWESCYVSVRKRELVNRGFLHGPFLPIYGSGAVTILISTIKFRDNLVAVFFFGMIAATILEYITGAAMERIFGVKYWDYSKRFLNVNGHICLIASLCWGIFSCLMIKVIHTPIEGLVLGLPVYVTEILAFIFTAYFSVDVTVSANEALDLKAMLNKISSEHEHLKFVADKLEIAYAFAEDEFNENKKKYRRKRRELSFIASRKKLHFTKYIENKKNDLTDSMEAFKETKLNGLSRTADTAKELLKKKLIDETILKAALEVISKEEDKVKATDRRQIRNLTRILKRNPMATFKDSEAMNEIKQLMKK